MGTTLTTVHAVSGDTQPNTRDNHSNRSGGQDAWQPWHTAPSSLTRSTHTRTGDVYGHTSDDTARAAVDGWSGALGL